MHLRFIHHYHHRHRHHRHRHHHYHQNSRAVKELIMNLLIIN